MKLTIDNLDGLGAVDYTSAVDTMVAPRIVRKMNQPATFECSLLGVAGLAVATAGARICVIKSDGTFLFTGYLTRSPECAHLGWGEQTPVYRYGLLAESDEFLLDQKVLPGRAPFVARSAGSALKQLAQDLLPGGFDLSGVQDLDAIASYQVNPQKKFSFHAAEIAAAARASYRAMNGALSLAPVGASSYSLSESDGEFSPVGLKLESPLTEMNDVTVIGLEEPQSYVRDYFVGDGLSLRFYLSQTPFQQGKTALIDERYTGPGLDATTWVTNDPSSAVSVAAQALQVSGGTGQDGQTSVSFIELIEMGGALELQHGDVSFTGASQGIIGGLYAGAIAAANCVAGFQVRPAGSQSSIQALINGSAAGTAVTTAAGHRYVLTTYLYSMEAHRAAETYHSSAHPAENGVGGGNVAANLRIVLELQDIDPSVPSSLVAPAAVLFDDAIQNAPAFCTYALVDAVSMQCSIAYTYAAHIALAEVRTALPGDSYATQLVESLSDGGQCEIASSTTLDFYPQYVPPLNTLIVASYRGTGRAVAEVLNTASVAALAHGADDGVRGTLITIKLPSARTQADCENAALAMLDDATAAAWKGSYETWSDFLPGSADDLFPGDGLSVSVSSQNASFSATVRKVSIELHDPGNDRGLYTIEFANDLAEALALQVAESTTTVPLQDLSARLMTSQVGSYYLANLTNAQITQISATTVQVDAGIVPTNGGIEVRMHDFGWGSANDRNLLGRFSTQTFTVPRLARTQNYFLRLYDSSSPPRYSRYAAALHVDYPL